MPLEINLDSDTACWKLTLAGDLDYSECSHFRMNIDRILGSPPPAAIVDLSKVGYLDSSGLGLLLSLHSQYEKLGKRLVLVTSDMVDEMLRLSRLDRIFTIATDVGHAARMVDAPAS